MGRGSWPRFYHPGDDFRGDPQGRDAHGIRALKRETIYSGFAKGIVAELPFYGKQFEAMVRAFQSKNKWAGVALIPDGVIGPRTAGALFRKRAVFLEKRYGILNHWLVKLKTLESANDPVCEGEVDPDDEGLMQINLHFNPSVTLEQAWEPAWAMENGAQRLKDGIAYCGDEEGGVAAYNIGRVYAKRWVQAGKPASGGPLIGTQDAYKRATAYVSVVRKAAW